MVERPGVRPIKNPNVTVHYEPLRVSCPAGAAADFTIAESVFHVANRPSMSLDAPESRRVDGAAFRFGIAAARFNGALVDGLLERVVAALRASGASDTNLTVLRVPGSHEVPWAAQALATGSQCDCIIGLGVLIAGDTSHHEMVGASVSAALQRVALDAGIPVVNGVLVVNTVKEAEERCVGRINRGAEFAAAALEMAGLKRRFCR
jgi:6,7-dimethyl-8-ribityllumazine synthase